MSFNEVIEQILSSRLALTREEVLNMIDKKKREAMGFFTNEVAARLVASELGLEIRHEPFQSEVLVRDLVSGLRDVTVTGRVIAVYPPKTFTRSDWTEGRVANLLIADKTGTLKVVLWDKKASLVEAGNVEQEQIVRVSHGYVREGRSGKLELHVGLRGSIQTLPADALENEYASTNDFHEETKKVAEVKKEDGPITVEGTVITTPITRDVVISQGETVAVSSFELEDDTGKILVSAWRTLVNIVKNLTPGTWIKIKNAYVRKGFSDQLELTSRAVTSIEIPSKLEE
jgi:replication factor A1